MTSKTSLFNKTIYKNTLSRFKWGSFLYFIILFFSTAFIILMQSPVTLISRFASMRNYISGMLILRSDYFIFPVLLSLIVPTVTAVLVYGNVHSAKQGIFIHGLPVTRKENFVSVLLAALTLMALPVLAMGIIFLIMSFTSFGALISLKSILIWVGYNLAVLFIMFSVACFAGFLTGHPAAHIGINALLHVIPLLVALFIYLISEIYLFGFVESENFIANLMVKYNPICFLFTQTTSSMSRTVEIFSNINIWLYILGAVILYFISYFTYKARKIEACGDVSAFESFKPVLKYTVTSGVAVASVAILYSMEVSTFIMFFVAAVISAIAYFIAEMLLLKTVKVFKRYKGFLGFVVISALVFSFSAFTSMFGYETRIPEKDEISKATISENWREETLFENGAIIDTVLSYHKEFIKDIPVKESRDNILPWRIVYVSYELKNGDTLVRKYKVLSDKAIKVLNTMYSYPEYKLDATNLSTINIENVEWIDINKSVAGTYMLEELSHIRFAGDNAVEFLKAVKQDVLDLTYSQIYVENSPISFSANTNMTAYENEVKNAFVKKNDNFTEQYIDDYIQEVYHFSIHVNNNFKNAMNYLKNAGYIDSIKTAVTDKMYILKEPVVMTFENDHYSKATVSYKEDTGTLYEFSGSDNDLILLEKEDAEKVFDYLLTINDMEYEKDGTYYNLYIRKNNDNSEYFSLGDYFFRFEQNSIPDYIAKYLTR